MVRQKRCSRCQVVKPWHEFYAQRKWPDGTMRVPQCRCKQCAREVRAEQKRADRIANPEKWQARASRLWTQIKADHERHMSKVVYDRDRRRAALGITPDRFRGSRYQRGEGGHELVNAEPLRELLRNYAGEISTLAEASGVGERRLRDIRSGAQKGVTVENLERVLIALGMTLRDVMPDLYSEAA